MTTAAACKKGHEWTEANTYVPHPTGSAGAAHAARSDRNRWHAAAPRPSWIETP